MSTTMRSNQTIARLIKIKTINMTHVNQGHHYTTDSWGNKCKQPVQLKRAHTKRLNFMTHTLAILVAILVSHMQHLGEWEPVRTGGCELLLNPVTTFCFYSMNVSLMFTNIHPLDRTSSGTTTSLSQSLLSKHVVCDGCNWCKNHEHFLNQYR